MKFIETPIFTKAITSLLSDDAYNEMQQTLVINPEAGKIISGSGGLRKLRWAVPGKGKKGGLRLIYYWIGADDEIYMLYIYKKSEKEDLAKARIKVLKKLVEEHLI